MPASLKALFGSLDRKSTVANHEPPPATVVAALRDSQAFVEIRIDNVRHRAAGARSRCKERRKYQGRFVCTKIQCRPFSNLLIGKHTHVKMIQMSISNVPAKVFPHAGQFEFRRLGMGKLA